MVARHFQVYGQVQGVGYRYFALRAAAQHQIKGWVRNLPDGSVEVWAEGNTRAMESFKLELATGPMYAEVTQLCETDVEPTLRYGTFRIEH
ncbi:MAG: acylphosphatase [Blastocatellia bacterium]|nr:acylphosphatase [Blastocatellia bacterium]